MSMTGKERLDYSRDWIKRLDSQWTDIKTHRETAIKFCNGDPSIVKIIENRAKLVTTDMQDAIDLAKPDILETIAGLDEPLKLDPTKKHRIEDIKALQKMANVIIRRRNEWYRTCDSFLDNSMKLIIGFIKYQYVRKENVTKKYFTGLSDEALALKLAEGGYVISDEPATAATEGEEAGPGTERETVIGYKTTQETVQLNSVPPECLKFPIDIGSIRNAPFVVEEVLLYQHEFINTYGEKAFRKVKNMKREFEKSNLLKERFKHLGGQKFFYDSKLDKYKAHECYFYDKHTNEPIMFVFAGDEIIINEENKYGRPPYEGSSPFQLADMLIGKGYLHYLQAITEKRTVLDRQIFDNLIQANHRRYFGQGAMIDMDAFLNNNSTNAFINTQGDPRGIVMPEEKAQLPGEVFAFREALLVEKDSHIPTPRAFAGIDPMPGEKTYRGRQLKQNAAAKKLLMMIRGYMECTFAPLFADVIECILNFFSDEAIAEFFDEGEQHDFKDIQQHYDLIVNVGLGTQDRQDLIVKLQQLINLGLGLVQFGTVTPKDLHYMFSELVKAMGFLNTEDFSTDPGLKEAVMELIQLITMMLQHIGAQEGQTPAFQAVSGKIQEAMQKVLTSLGVMPKQIEDKGGANTEGTQPGQLTAPQPMNPMNPMNAQAGISGGDFFA